MKNLFLFAILTFFVSCDPGYNINYYIDNNSDQTVEVIFSNNFMDTTYNVLPAQSQLRIFLDSNLGMNNEDYLMQLDSLPMVDLEIKTVDGEPCLLEEGDLSSWAIIQDNKSAYNNSVILTLSDQDF